MPPKTKSKTSTNGRRPAPAASSSSPAPHTPRSRSSTSSGAHADAAAALVRERRRLYAKEKMQEARHKINVTDTADEDVEDKYDDDDAYLLQCYETAVEKGWSAYLADGEELHIDWETLLMNEEHPCTLCLARGKECTVLLHPGLEGGCEACRQVDGTCRPQQCSHARGAMGSWFPKTRARASLSLSTRRSSRPPSLSLSTQRSSRPPTATPGVVSPERFSPEHNVQDLGQSPADQDQNQSEYTGDPDQDDYTGDWLEGMDDHGTQNDPYQAPSTRTSARHSSQSPTPQIESNQPVDHTSPSPSRSPSQALESTVRSADTAPASEELTQPSASPPEHPASEQPAQTDHASLQQTMATRPGPAPTPTPNLGTPAAASNNATSNRPSPGAAHAARTAATTNGTNATNLMPSPLKRKRYSIADDNDGYMNDRQVRARTLREQAAQLRAKAETERQARAARATAFAGDPAGADLVNRQSEKRAELRRVHAELLDLDDQIRERQRKDEQDQRRTDLQCDLLEEEAAEADNAADKLDPTVEEFL